MLFVFRALTFAAGAAVTKVKPSLDDDSVCLMAVGSRNNPMRQDRLLWNSEGYRRHAVAAAGVHEPGNQFYEVIILKIVIAFSSNERVRAATRVCSSSLFSYSGRQRSCRLVRLTTCTTPNPNSNPLLPSCGPIERMRTATTTIVAQLLLASRTTTHSVSIKQWESNRRNQQA